MDNQQDRLLWFFASFAPCFGGYVALHYMSTDTWGIIDLLGALASIPVLVTLWALTRTSNRSLAQGFIWSLAANFIFLFTFGGCGMLRITGP